VATANAGPKLLRLTNPEKRSIHLYAPQAPENWFFYTLAPPRRHKNGTSFQILVGPTLPPMSFDGSFVEIIPVPATFLVISTILCGRSMAVRRWRLYFRSTRRW